MRKFGFLTAILTVLLLASSCASKKSFQLSEAGRWAAITSRDSLAELLYGARGQNAALSEDVERLMGSVKNYQSLLASNQNENQKLSSSLAEKMNQLSDREKTIAELQRMINEQNRRVQALLSNVKDALLGFSSDELTVREEGGKVYVAMSDKLLFESGKAIVNAQGKNALGKLAQVLNKQTDIDVYIEGHTDNVPIKTAVFQDNWDLSVIRATSVVRILTETYGVQPLQIQPCGRGEFKPVDTNETAEGRARNRRTEIIMAPKLDKLFEMLKNN